MVDSARFPRTKLGIGPGARFEGKATDVGLGVQDEQPPSEEFSALQARLCPSTVQCCVPRTFTWYSVTIDNLKPITYEKEAMTALVIPEETKQMLLGLIEEHQRNESQGAITDFISNKGEVSTLICSERTLANQLNVSEFDNCPPRASGCWQNVDGWRV